MQLPNGDVVPSFLGISRTMSGSGNSYFNNQYLVKGEVINIVYPQDPASVSKLFIEYTVFIDNCNNNTANNEKFYSCVLINDLAGLADKSKYTLRKASNPPWETDEGFSDGSKVLILCVDGESQSGVIIGGLRDLKDTSEKKDTEKDPGHNAYWIFNGVNATVDKDGAFTLTFNGPTKNDGKLNTDKVKEEATGTVFSIDKDGNASLADKEQKNQLLINHKDSKIQNTADKEYDITVSNGKIITDSQGVELGGNNAKDKMLMGTTFRDSQKQMNQKMSGYFQTMSQLALTAGTQLTTASAGLILDAGAAPGIAAAGAAMLAMQSVIANLKASIDAFEAQSERYLSSKNKLDT